MKPLRYILLALTIWAIPSFLLNVTNESIGSISSHLMFIFFALYYLINSKGRLLLIFLLLGLSYYLIAGLVHTADYEDFAFTFLKYMIFIVVGVELIKRTSLDEIYFFLLLGALSIIVHSLFFPSDYGRYSGFYLNPNKAAIVALFGYGFSFMQKNRMLRNLGFVTFSIAGIITLSRYFLIMWIILSIISLFYNKKNATVFGIGIGVLLLILSISTLLQLNTLRFSAIENIFENKVNQGLIFLSENSRIDIWTDYYDRILDRPFFGNGYNTMDGSLENRSGVHNTFLLTFGEAGLIPVILLIVIYARLFFGSLKNFHTTPYALLLVLANLGYLFVSHNFYDDYMLLFFTLWIYLNLHKQAADETELEHHTISLKT